ncbi:hypothetical protein AcW2_006308 [Taiwanofungus camphoratus]|nr:hypothetical protein AcW2_006308 [Antrodia cinnamomea]
MLPDLVIIIVTWRNLGTTADYPFLQRVMLYLLFSSRWYTNFYSSSVHYINIGVHWHLPFCGSKSRMTTLFPSPCPCLPAFRTLLISGPYHPSAPVHLTLSHNAQSPSAKAILFSPSRQTFATALKGFNDQWINEHGADGSTYRSSSRVNIFYPPTSAHLNLLLHMLHEYNNSFCHSTTTLDVVPSLMVLHEISAFFSGASSDSTCVMDVHLHRTLQRDISYSISSYLTLISNAFTALKYLASQSSSDVALVVFDSGLDQLKLPIIRPLASADQTCKSTTSQARLESVAVFARRFFDWNAIAEVNSDASPMQSDADVSETRVERAMSMILRQNLMPGSDITWKWTEHRYLVGLQNGEIVYRWH